jgi:transposase
MKPNSQMTLDKYFRQCVGIDVSKDKFTACLFMYDMASDVGCCTESVDFSNSKTGFNQMVKWSRKEAQKGFLLTYLMEPTGSYYEPLAYHLHKIGLTLYVVLPNKARSFCEYEGIKTKTDAMDARCLALLGCKNQRLRPWQPPKAIYRELRQLTRLRASLTKMQTQIMNHIEAIDHMESVTLEVCKSYKKLLSTIQKQLEQNEQAIAAKVAQDKELEVRIKRIATAKGIRSNTVTCIVAETQGFHLITNRKQLASFAGLDVVAKQSGKDDPKHKISKKGNAYIRAALYMPALSAAHCNRQMMQSYSRICDKHPDTKMIGVTAIMRKMLLLVYTLWKSGEEYDESRDKTNVQINN